MYRTWLLILFLTSTAWADPIRVFVNESGAKVLTNIGTARSVTTSSEIYHEPLTYNYLSLINNYSIQYGVDQNLVRAIMEVESNFDPRAISPKGCIGLMQLHPDTATRFGVRNIFDPAENIEGGIRYLQYLLGYFKGNLRLVLAAYNAGENAVIRYQGIPPYRETRDYVRRVTTLYQPANPAPPSVSELIYRKVARVVQANGRVLLTNVPGQIF
ncbi:MAG: lytic transglycosylase domain-containing protein [Acidobacteria bacterium]|nr:lytic transglycosylase domain-containing protein [Acidobacteriota bacterium]